MVVRSTNLDPILDAAVEDGVVPGLVAVVSDADGTLYEGAAGTLAGGSDEDVTADTLFRIASMTKAITTVGALQLIERQELGLDDPVAAILPAFAELPVIDGLVEDTPRFRAPRTTATVRHLLTHTSGHGYWWGNAELARLRDRGDISDILAGQVSALDAPLVADPGERWEYGISTDWLGRVIEAVTGENLSAYLTEHVLAPLDMNDTSFELPSEDRSRVMPIHEHTADGGMKLSSFMWPDSSEFFAGGHGLYSSARDYARFLRAILRGGELDGSRILQEATVELALSDQLDGVPLPEFVPTQAAWLMCDVISFPVRQSWGYGFQLTLEDLPGMRRAGTVFWSGILNTYFWIDRQTSVAATVMTQLQPLFDPALLQLLATFESTLYAGS